MYLTNREKNVSFAVDLGSWKLNNISKFKKEKFQFTDKEKNLLQC